MANQRTSSHWFSSDIKRSRISRDGMVRDDWRCLCFSGHFVVWRLSQLLGQLHDSVLHPVQEDVPQHPPRLGKKQRHLEDTLTTSWTHVRVTHPRSHWSSRCWLTWGSALTSGSAFWLVCCTWASGTRLRRFSVTQGSSSSPCCSSCSPLWCPQCSPVSPHRGDVEHAEHPPHRLYTLHATAKKTGRLVL